jgi:uncharacterized OB-fold protein
VSEPSDTIAFPAPRPTPVSAPFWRAARQHRLELQFCGRCEAWIWYPRPFCPACLGDLEWCTASGNGVLYTFTVVRRAAHPAFEARVPYVHAIVELAEGPRMTTNIIGCSAERIRIGMAVRAVFEDLNDDVALVLFQPADA